MLELTGKFINLEPEYAKEMLEELNIDYEEWTSNLWSSDVEIRVDLDELKENQKLNLCKEIGLNLNELKKTNFLIFF